MKHFSKQLSWLLAFVLIFTSIVSTGIPVYASDTIVIGEDTDEVIVSGVEVGCDNYIRIRYYESADSDTVLYEDFGWGGHTIGSADIAIKSYAWHIKYIKTVSDYSRSGSSVSYFKAYPDTSLENVPESTTISYSEGTTVTTTGAAINVSIYVGTTELKNYSIASSKYTLPNASQLRSLSGDTLDTKLGEKGSHLPDLTKLYYTVELVEKSTSSYSLKLTLVPTVEITFDNAGTPVIGAAKYATQSAPIDNTKLPTFFLEGKDFYGLQNPSSGEYAYLANVTDDNISSLELISGDVTLKVRYQEKKPTYTLDLENQNVEGLLQGRAYICSVFDHYWQEDTKTADSNGSFSYKDFPSKYARFSLKSEDSDVLNSEFAWLAYETPNSPTVEYTSTTARVKNINDFDGSGYVFAIKEAYDYSDPVWEESSEFKGLIPEQRYDIYVKRNGDENRFESLTAKSKTFTTPAVKAVSNEAPNGVTIPAIPDQTHTGNAIEPALMIKDGGKALVQGTDYTVAYSNNTNAGTATATVTFTGNYSGIMTKDFNIILRRSSNSGGGGKTTPTVTIKFNTDGGSTVGSKNLKKGSTIGEIPAPTKEGYVFAGWYSDKELTKAYDANTVISESTTLYANWIKAEPANDSENELVLTIGKKEAKVFGSDKTNDAAPIIRNDRTMLPGRFVAESLGAVVTWNGKKQEVTVKGKNEKGEDVTILIYIGSDIALVNGKEVKLDSPAFINSGRTYTPVRFIAERLGATVDWVKSERKVVITKSK